jgi:hypothetical protein
MKRSKRSRAAAVDALDDFRKLTRADALLFYVADILREMNLAEIASSIDGARARIAQRLEACQDGAYVQMKQKDPPRRNPAPSRQRPRPKTTRSKRG